MKSFCVIIGKGIVCMNRIVFETTVSFLEMLTSCYFAMGLFRKVLKSKKDILTIFGFAFFGGLLLTLRETGVLPMPDYVPALVVFGIYAVLICCAKWWSALLWALLNYLLIGAVVITTNSIWSIVASVPLTVLLTQTNVLVMRRVIVRLGQLLLSEIILVLMRRFREPMVRKWRGGIIGISIVSIAGLMALWNLEIRLTEQLMLYFNIFICLLVVLFNFGVLFFGEILSEQKYDNRTLTEKNMVMSMHIRNQNEMNEIYNEMRALKHDMNNHLHAISGYIQIAEYEKAEKYIQEIIGEVQGRDFCQSGNRFLDALIGSKSALAKKNGIRLEIHMDAIAELQILENHLAVVIGNLYDNAIDACLKLNKTESRYIKIDIRYHSDNLLLVFENAAKGADRGNGALWRSSKKAVWEHGFGLKNIDRIVQLYGGYCNRELKDDIFYCRIRIPDICR